jgi:hypothetical protein
MEYLSHTFREGVDTDGKLRQALVFHLLPVGTTPR